MGRPPQDPSGAKKAITVRVTPAALEALDTMAQNRGLNRSQMITRLLDRAWAAEQAKR